MACKLQNRHVLICEGQAFSVSSDDGQKTVVTEVHGLRSSQEELETDSRMILYCKYGVDKLQLTKAINISESEAQTVTYISYSCTMQSHSHIQLFSSKLEKATARG